MAVDPRHSSLVTKARAAAAQLMSAQEVLESVIKEFNSVDGATWLDAYWAEGAATTTLTEAEFIGMGVAAAAITATLDANGMEHRRALNRAKG